MGLIAAAGAVPELVRLLNRSTDIVTLQQSAWALANLSAVNRDGGAFANKCPAAPDQPSPP